MGLKFSVIRGQKKRYNRKRLLLASTATGMAFVMLHITGHDACKASSLKITAKIANQSAPDYQTGDIWGLKGVRVKEMEQEQSIEPENAVLAQDTLLGIPSVTNEEQQQKLLQSEGFFGRPAKTTSFDMGNWFKTIEEQNQDALQVQQAKEKKDPKDEEVIKLSAKDRAVLLRIVEAEATDADVKGRMLVANVVLNRVNCKTEFPDNVTDVVFDTTGGVYQFSPIEDGRYWSVSISDKTREAVHRVLCGEDESQGALYFMARQYADADNVVWFDSSLSYLFAYGEHEFFS